MPLSPTPPKGSPEFTTYKKPSRVCDVQRTSELIMTTYAVDTFGQTHRKDQKLKV
jgi:hypothetical protein